MKLKKLKILISLLTMFLIISPIQAHHSRAMFENHSINMTGTVTRKLWRNPHVYYEIETMNKNGMLENWILEAGSVSGMIQTGWNENTLNVGDLVTVTVSVHIDPDRKYASLDGVIAADGREYGAFVPGALTEVTSLSDTISTDLSGTWTVENSINQDGSVGNEATGGPIEWPLTLRGREQVENFDAANDPSFECIFYGVPRLGTSVYSRRIQRSSNTIVIVQEQYPITRTIYLDGSTRPENFEPSPIGYSTGYFEDDGTLVAETDGFSFTSWGSAAGLDSSAQKHVTERFELADDGLHMTYTYTINDPVFLDEPVTKQVNYKKIDDFEYVYEVCDADVARFPIEFGR